MRENRRHISKMTITFLNAQVILSTACPKTLLPLSITGLPHPITHLFVLPSSVLMIFNISKTNKVILVHLGHIPLNNQPTLFLRQQHQIISMVQKTVGQIEFVINCLKTIKLRLASGSKMCVKCVHVVYHPQLISVTKIRHLQILHN